MKKHVCTCSCNITLFENATFGELQAFIHVENCKERDTMHRKQRRAQYALQWNLCSVLQKEIKIT